MNRKGLGKGLGALISEAMPDSEAGGTRQVPVGQVRPNPYQPRQDFDPEKLAEMAQSIREHGILQPIALRKSGIDSFEIIAGERRFRGAQAAGLETIPAVIRECTDEEMLELALIENIQREDINPVEAARAYQRLATEFGMTQEQVATQVGKARSTVANTLRLLALPDPILSSLRAGEVSEAHARFLLQVEPEDQVSVWEEVRRRNLSVRETEALARKLRESAPKPRKRTGRPTNASRKDPNHVAIEEALQVALGTRVTIKPSADGGTVEIEYYSAEELEGIVEKIIGG